MLKKLFIGIIMFLILIPIILLGYLYFRLNSIYDKNESSKIEQIIGEASENEGIKNILLVGVDGNNLEKGNRSDSMIILTVDEKNKKLKLTSLARDTLVNIKNHGEEKLTHSYAYGGASLLLETINENFGLKIDKYISVNFESFKTIINTIGGVEINVLPKEVPYIPGVDKEGRQVLNGEEALAYSRIRYADNAYERDKRQRTVIESAYQSLKEISLSGILNIGNSLLEYTKTNLEPMEILNISKQVLKIKNSKFEQLEFPVEGHREGKKIEGKGWVIIWDKDYNKEKIKEFIYN